MRGSHRSAESPTPIIHGNPEALLFALSHDASKWVRPLEKEKQSHPPMQRNM